MAGLVVKFGKLHNLGDTIQFLGGLGNMVHEVIDLSCPIGLACSCRFQSRVVVPLCFLMTWDLIGHSHQG